MARKLSLQDLLLNGKKLLLRVDFNVPLDKSGAITDDSRIVAVLPTIRYALDHGATVILMSHLGRPKGKRDSALSLAPCAVRLSQLLGRPVKLAADCVGSEVEQLVKGCQVGDVVLLENLRFHEAEEHPEKDPTFAKRLAQLGDVYVDDAFGAAHRPHSSITDITRFFPGRAAAGLLMEKELTYLGKHLEVPKRPFCAILGGAKVSTKIALVRALLQRVDALLVGGAMAFTFLKAKGLAVGASLCEDEFLEEAKKTLALSEQTAIPIYLPIDAVIQSTANPEEESRVVSLQAGIPTGYRGVDIGPATSALFRKQLVDAGTVFWNGPMGIFENDVFAKGTYAVAEAVVQSKGVTIVGGGDSIAALQKLGLANRMSHLSTGGGASLEFVESGSLVGIEALSDAPKSDPGPNRHTETKQALKK